MEKYRKMMKKRKKIDFTRKILDDFQNKSLRSAHLTTIILLE